MSETVSIANGIAGRYASAVFDLALEQGALAALESDIAALDAALTGSGDFRALIASPLIGRDAQLAAITALAPKMGLSEVMSNTLRLMASKRRLFVLPQLIGALRARVAEHRGEITAEVTAPEPLSAAQAAQLAEALGAVVGAGKTVKINSSVDESLIGGLVIKLGSKMIDTSIRSKLARLGTAMKEVG